ncbi:hypothetical protein ACFW0V_30965 [Micromonospora parva]|uniref:hypothetical protein n=1 Tax=Micromonospora parva TaxID=1464048 RepID=UPI00366D5071
MSTPERRPRTSRAAGAGAPAEEWTTAEVLAYLAEQGRPITANTWYSYVSRQQAPAPTRYIGRTPVWSPEEVRQYDREATRPRRAPRDGAS